MILLIYRALHGKEETLKFTSCYLCFSGECTGLPHKPGNRMATMVLYCTVPKLGGHTNFRNAGVHVKPKAGNGIFFSYIDPEKLVMDNGE